jgi:hypothetical protein
MKNQPSIAAMIERCEAEIESSSKAIETVLTDARNGSTAAASAIVQFATTLLRATHELQAIMTVCRIVEHKDREIEHLKWVVDRLETANLDAEA